MHLQEVNVSEFQNQFFCYRRDVVSLQIAAKIHQIVYWTGPGKRI